MLLGSYFRLWSALVHTWLKRHCLDDVLQQEVLPLRVPRHTPPSLHAVPHEPSTPVKRMDSVLPAATAATAHGDHTQRHVSASPHRPRISKLRRISGAMTAYFVSAMLHEAIFIMCIHEIRYPSFFGALLTLGIYTALERKVGQVLPWFLVTFAVFLGHGIVYLQLANVIIDVVQFRGFA